MERYLHTALSADPKCWEHRVPADHPERPARLDAVVNALAAADLIDRLYRLPPRRATVEEIALCHTTAYIGKARAEIGSGNTCLSTGDTYVCQESFDAALHAAGASLSAVDVVMESKARNAFCAVRPPGHHATAEAGMGFCVFNNAAIAAQYARRKYGLKRVLIVDWDVHHGNGTQDIFYADGSVYYFSVHQHPCYPGTGLEDEVGEGDGYGTTRNVPLPPGTAGPGVLAAFRNHLLPAMASFRPEFVVISAGFDARVDDPIGDFRLTDHDFESLTAMVMDVAKESAGGRLISLLEGGYNPHGLGRAVAAHVRTLIEHA